MLQLGILLLASYALHILEEYAFGFPVWAEAHTGLAFTQDVFLRLNATFFGVMTACVVAGMLFAPAQWLTLPLGTAVLINGTAHLVASFLTWSYSPGLVTGTLLWIPLGLRIIRTSRHRWRPSGVRAGIVLGIGLHVLVPLSAWLATRAR
jgi:hypothetical protein